MIGSVSVVEKRGIGREVIKDIEDSSGVLGRRVK